MGSNKVWLTGTYNTNNRIKFKTLKSSLCKYSDTYILVKGTITITGGPENATNVNKRLDERNV